MPLYILEKGMGSVILIDLRGRITLGEETMALRMRVSSLVRDGYSRIVLDLEQIDYIDSVGLSTLVAIHNAARAQGGRLKLIHLTTRIRDLLQITRLSTVFETYNSFDDARRAFDAEAPA